MSEQDIPGDLDEGTRDTFASVWVKVEMDDDENEEVVTHKPEEPQKLPKPKKKQNRTVLQCEQCSYTTVHRSSLKAHILDHLNLKPHVCNICGYSTKYPISLQRHMTIKHNESSDDNKTLLYCDSCDYSTYFKWNLNSHKRKHATDKKFQCDHCSYSTAYRHNYLKHSRVHHKVSTEYKCDKCPFVTKFVGHIQRHLSQIHNEVSEKANACDVCDFTTMMRWRLNVHKQRSRRENPLKCGMCGFQTYYMCENKKHKKSHFNDVFEVRQIKGGDGAVDKTVMDDAKEHSDELEGSGVDQTHSNVTEKEEELTENGEKINDLKDTTMDDKTEEACKAATVNAYVDNGVNANKVQISHESELKYHVSDKIMEDIFKAGSPICDTVNGVPDNRGAIDDTNDYNDYFADHSTTNMNANTNPPKLRKVKNYFVDANCETQNSIQVLESDDVGRRFQCIRCPYTSKFKASVIRHHQRHHTSEDRPYKCCNCDFSTKTKDQISLHNKRSQSEGTLICSICNFTTNFRCSLVMHQKVHYAHKCNICDYSCRNKYDLQKHFATVHMGEGLKCRFCDHRSGRRESLLCHEAIHTGRKPFNCDLCDYQSVRKSLLEVHFRRCHSDVIDGKVEVSLKSESE